MKKVIYFNSVLCLFLFCSQSHLAAVPVYANSQNTGSGGLCVGCSVSNAANATDGNLTTYSTLNLTVGALGAYVYQNLSFPSTGASGNYVGLVLEDDNLGILDATVLGGLSLTTYNGGVSNGDSHGGIGLNIHLLSGSTTKYYVEFPVASAFDQVQVKLNAGIVGALSKLRIYYGYYNASPLPVTFLYFKVGKEAGTVKVKWATATETNNDKFVLQRSDNGMNFTDIAVFPGKTFSDNVTLYEFDDKDPLPGTNYYRLMQLDLGGKTSFSDLISIGFSSGSVSSGLTLYFASGKKITENIPSDQKDLVAKVYNIYTGQIICSGSLRDNEITFENDLNSGFYALQIISNDKIIKSEKFVIP